jgi:hypothetical protein
MDSVKVGDIVRHQWNRGSEKGFFKVIRLDKQKLRRWSRQVEDVAICKLVSHGDGTVPISKNLKERVYAPRNLTLVTPEIIAAEKVREVAAAKAMVKRKAEVWDKVLVSLFPDSIEEAEEVEIEDDTDFLASLSGVGTGLLRKAE